MDLFALDRLVIDLVQRVMSDPMLQFGIMAGIGAIVSGLFPDKSNKSGSNKK